MPFFFFFFCSFSWSDHRALKATVWQRPCQPPNSIKSARQLGPEERRTINGVKQLEVCVREGDGRQRHGEEEEEEEEERARGSQSSSFSGGQCVRRGRGRRKVEGERGSVKF